MREMRHIVSLFNASSDFDEQWILLKSYLNTAHSMYDNDVSVKRDFHRNELMNFAIVLRNILHHQPAKWHFGKHDVFPTGMTVKIVAGQSKMTASLSLVIQKDTLQEAQLQSNLGNVSSKQLEVLKRSLEAIASHVIVVKTLMEQVQAYVESYCRANGNYTDSYDGKVLGYNLLESR